MKRGDVYPEVTESVKAEIAGIVTWLTRPWGGDASLVLAGRPQAHPRAHNRSSTPAAMGAPCHGRRASDFGSSGPLFFPFSTRAQTLLRFGKRFPPPVGDAPELVRPAWLKAQP